VEESAATAQWSKLPSSFPGRRCREREGPPPPPPLISLAYLKLSRSTVQRGGGSTAAAAATAAASARLSAASSLQSTSFSPSRLRTSSFVILRTSAEADSMALARGIRPPAIRFQCLTGGFFGFFFYVLYSTRCFICRPSDSTVWGGCWDRTQDGCCDFGIGSQRL
jgi:hypothetical protein